MLSLRRFRFKILAVGIVGGCFFAMTFVANAASLVWVGGNGSWEVAGNWTPNTSPDLTTANTDDMTFGNTANTTVTLRNTNDEQAVRTITFDANAGAYTFVNNGTSINNQDVNLTGAADVAPSLTNNSNNVQTFSAGLDLGAVAADVVTVNATGFDAGTGYSIDVTGGPYGLYVAGQVTFNGPGKIHVGSGSKLWGNVNQSIIANTDIISDGPWVGAGSGGNPVNKDGASTLFLNASGTINRPVIIKNGAIRISNGGALGTVQPTTTSGGATTSGRLELTNSISTAEPLRIVANQLAAANNISIESVSGNNTLTGAITLTDTTNADIGDRYNFQADSGATLTLGGNITVATTLTATNDRIFSFGGAGNGTLAASTTIANNNVGGTLPVLKSGAGTFTVNGAINVNSAGGGTSPDVVVNGGSIVVSSTGAITNARGLHVASGATFDASAAASSITVGTGQPFSTFIHGNGTIKGNVVASTGGTIQAGGTELYDTVTSLTPVSAVGQLNFNNDLDLSGGGTLNWKLGALSTSGAGTNFDLISVVGNLALAGSSTLSLDFSLLPSGQQPGNGDAFWTSGHTWKIIDTGANAGPTNFATIANGTFGSGQFTTSVGSGTDAGDILLKYTSATLNGDYNSDGKVDAADYVVWRKNPTVVGGGNPVGYNTWRANFGAGSGAGSQLTSLGSSVPEPSGIAIAMVALLMSFGVVRKKFD